MYSYHDCYKILSIESGCDWAEVRKAYKLKIQKWHPDRIIDATMKSAAEDKLKQLNLAYEQLSAYYKKHGYLPTQEKTVEVVADNVDPDPVRARPQRKTSQKPDNDVKKTDRSASLTVSKPSGLLSLFVFTLIGFSLYTLFDVEKSSNRSMPELDPTLPVNSSLPGNNAKTDWNDNTLDDDSLNSSVDNEISHKEEDYSHVEIEYFTIGSSVRDVLRIQGTPDSVIDNIWFYGESTIEFEDGVVKDWKRTAANPLKAHMDL